ncbi:MAG TPA: T9SS type A sorting domain-containing protein [Pelobium sp.]|nr:T9SS type A sorting domain-containing protein [Pelobium sp.]
MKKLLFTTMLLVFAMVGFGQTATDGDYRSVASGNWTNVATWQVRIDGNWVAASVAPTSANNVYLQTGHVVTIDAENVYCKDLHWGYTGSTYGAVELGLNVINISGKVRVYSMIGPAETSLGSDGTFYSGQTSSNTLSGTQFVSSQTAGYIKFVGGSRTITEYDSWKSSGTVCYGVFALDDGATGTLEGGMKFRGLTIESGTVNCDNVSLAIGASAGTGDITIKNGAKLISSRADQVLTASSTRLLGTLTIESGAVLELTNANPEINCTNFVNNGEVIYSGNAENFAIPVLAGGNELTSYNNLTINTTAASAKLPAEKNISVAGTLTLQSGNLEIPSTASLTLTNGDNAIVGGSNTSYIKTLVNGADFGTLKVVALSTQKAFPIGSATNYLPVTLSPESASNFSLNVFTGATTDATVNGTAFTATQKNDIVDAIWNINRTSGTGNCDVTFAWDDALEGSNFSGTGLGVSNFSSGTFGAFGGTVNATTNTATVSSATLGQFLVGKSSVLPVTLISFTAKTDNGNIALAWKSTSEVNLSHYIVQRSTNGVDFENLTTVEANNKPGIFDYTFVDKTASFGASYYQLISVDIDGKTQKSELKSASLGASAANVIAYPNPTINQLNISGLVSGDVIKMFNTSGQLLTSKNAIQNQVNVLDMSDVKAGLYILSIENSGKISSNHRIIKQ